MTTGEGIVVAAGALVLAGGLYAFVQGGKADSQAENARLQAQLAAQLAAAQRPPQANTGSKVLDTGLGIFNALGGVGGIVDLVERISD